MYTGTGKFPIPRDILGNCPAVMLPDTAPKSATPLHGRGSRWLPNLTLITQFPLFPKQLNPKFCIFKSRMDLLPSRREPPEAGFDCLGFRIPLLRYQGLETGARHPPPCIVPYFILNVNISRTRACLADRPHPDCILIRMDLFRQEHRLN